MPWHTAALEIGGVGAAGLYHYATGGLQESSINVRTPITIPVDREAFAAACFTIYSTEYTIYPNPPGDPPWQQVSELVALFSHGPGEADYRILPTGGGGQQCSWWVDYDNQWSSIIVVLTNDSTPPSTFAEAAGLPVEVIVQATNPIEGRVDALPVEILTGQQPAGDLVLSVGAETVEVLVDNTGEVREKLAALPVSILTAFNPDTDTPIRVAALPVSVLTGFDSVNTAVRLGSEPLEVLQGYDLSPAGRVSAIPVEVLLQPPTTIPPALHKVQGTAKFKANNSVSIQVTFTTPPTIGNALILMVSGYSTDNIHLGAKSIVTDNYGHEWIAGVSNFHNVAGNGVAGSIFFVRKLTATGASFTISYSRDNSLFPTAAPPNLVASAVEVGGEIGYGLLVDAWTGTAFVNSSATSFATVAASPVPLGPQDFIAAMVVFGSPVTGAIEVQKNGMDDWTEAYAEYDAAWSAEADTRTHLSVDWESPPAASWTVPPSGPLHVVTLELLLRGSTHPIGLHQYQKDALEITSFPFVATYDVTGTDANSHGIWWKYTAKPGDNAISFWANTIHGPGALPVSYVAKYNEDLSSANGGSGFPSLPGQVAIIPGQVYYFNYVNTGQTSWQNRAVWLSHGVTVEVDSTLLQTPEDLFERTFVIVNSDIAPTNPTPITDLETGKVISLIPTFPAGEQGIRILDSADSPVAGYSMYDDGYGDEKQHIFNAQLEEVAVVDWYSGGDTICITHNHKDAFYSANPYTDNDTLEVAVIGLLDTRAPESWGIKRIITFPYPSIKAYAVSRDETIFYFSGMEDDQGTYQQHIMRWDLVANKMMTPFNTYPDISYNTLLVMKDGSLVGAGMRWESGDYLYIWHYNPDGSLRAEFPYQTVDGYALRRADWGFYLNYAEDTPEGEEAYWLFGQFDDYLKNGVTFFRKIRLSDGAVLKHVESPQFNGGTYSARTALQPIYPPLDRFGHDKSCPFVVYEPKRAVAPELPECCQDDYSLWQDNFSDVDLAQDYAGWLGVQAYPLEFPTGVKSIAYGSFLSKGVAPWGREFSVEIINNFDELYFFQHDEAHVIELYNIVRDSSSPGLVVSLRQLDGKAVVWYNPPPIGNIPEAGGAFDHSVWHKIRLYGALSTYDETSESFRSDGSLTVSVDGLIIINRINIPLYAENAQFNAAREGSWNHVKVYPAGHLTCLYIGNGNFCDEPITQLPGYCPPQTANGGGTGNSGGNDGGDPTEPYVDPDGRGSGGTECSLGGSVPVSPDPPPPESWYT